MNNFEHDLIMFMEARTKYQRTHVDIVEVIATSLNCFIISTELIVIDLKSINNIATQIITDCDN